MFTFCLCKSVIWQDILTQNKLIKQTLCFFWIFRNLENESMRCTYVYKINVASLGGTNVYFKKTINALMLNAKHYAFRF